MNGEEEEEVEDDEERGGVGWLTLWWWRWRKSLSLEALNSVAGNFCLNSKPKDRAGVKDLKSVGKALILIPMLPCRRVGQSLRKPC